LKIDIDFLNNKNELIKSLVDIRKSLNLSKEEIALNSGIPINVVSKIENLDNNVKLDVFLRYTAALGIKIHIKAICKVKMRTDFLTLIFYYSIIWFSRWNSILK